MEEKQKPDTERNASKTPEIKTIFDRIQIRDIYRISYIANRTVLPVYDEIKADYDLNRGEYLLLLCLSVYDELTAQDVANMSGQPRNTISRSVHRVLEKGLITRRSDPDDGRQAWLAITEAGRQLQKELSQRFQDKETALLSVLNEEERERLDEILNKLVIKASPLS